MAYNQQLINAYYNIQVTNNINNRPLSFMLENAREVMFDYLKRGLREKEGKTNVRYLATYNEIADWLSDNKGKGLLLIGKQGLGKTRMLEDVIAPVLNYKFRKHDERGCYHDTRLSIHKATELDTKLFEEPDPKHPNSIANRIVLIDDIGTEHEFSNYGSKYFQFPRIVDDAESKHKLLVVTTNLFPEDIISRYTERTWSRLCGTTKIVVFGENIDLRKEA